MCSGGGASRAMEDPHLTARDDPDAGPPRQGQRMFLNRVMVFSDLLARGAGSAAELLGDRTLRACAAPQSPFPECTLQRPAWQSVLRASSCRRRPAHRLQTGAPPERGLGEDRSPSAGRGGNLMMPVLTCIAPRAQEGDDAGRAAGRAAAPALQGPAARWRPRLPHRRQCSSPARGGPAAA